VRQGLAHRTRPQLAVEMLKVLCGAHECRRFHAIADSAYGGQSVLNALPVNCGLTSRLALNARLYDTPPERKPGTNGRPRKRGRRLPTPKQMLQQRAARVTLDLYGRHDRSRVAETVARVHTAPTRPLRIVAVEPLTGGRTTQAFYSTNPSDTAEQVLMRYAMRWSIEEMNQASKSHLGFEEPQGWTRRAVERTAPTAMLLYSLIVLWFAKIGHRHYQAPVRPWYTTKRNPSFADMLATLRRMTIEQEVSALRIAGRGSRKVIKTMLQTLQRAA
jgi:SRSO17 transposase